MTIVAFERGVWKYLAVGGISVNCGEWVIKYTLQHKSWIEQTILRSCIDQACPTRMIIVWCPVPPEEWGSEFSEHICYGHSRSVFYEVDARGIRRPGMSKLQWPKDPLTIIGEAPWCLHFEPKPGTYGAANDIEWLSVEYIYRKD
jgi:hypothetical protein